MKGQVGPTWNFLGNGEGGRLQVGLGMGGGWAGVSESGGQGETRGCKNKDACQEFLDFFIRQV